MASSPKDAPESTITVIPATHPEDSEQTTEIDSPSSRFWSRKVYFGSLLFNLCSFLLPALYSTLSKFWVSQIDSSMLVTTDAYTYIGVVVEILNEGLPRAAWNVIGDASNRSLSARRQLAFTLITTQAILGSILSVIFVAAAELFAASFVPEEVRSVSVTYVRISGFAALASALETAVATATRALDQPDVPLVISMVKFVVNIVLDLLIISKFHVKGVTPTVNAQAVTQLVCGLAAAFAGLGYFLWTTLRKHREEEALGQTQSVRPSFSALTILARPGLFTFLESAIRNALYLWLISGVVAMGLVYATAWSVFNTIRWGLIMVPVQALEATSLTFAGHRWGVFRSSVGINNLRPTASKSQIWSIIAPALRSCLIALIVEVPLALFLSFYGARHFAYYLSASEEVALVTEKMWRTIDWCYVFYALSTQLATILLATRPLWYLYQSLVSNLCWVLPWAIAISRIGITVDNAWKYHSIVFGGSLVFSFLDISIVVGIWAWALAKGKVHLPAVKCNQ